MRRVMITLAVALGALAAVTDGMAQDRTFVLMEALSKHSFQAMPWSGTGNELPEAEIKKYWDEGAYITSAAYTEKGWMVCMSKNSLFRKQLYYYDTEFPTDSIFEKISKGYVITTLSSSATHFLVVMSQHELLNQQLIEFAPSSEIREWYNKMRNEGRFVTAAMYYHGNWLLVASKGSRFTSQDYIVVDESIRLTMINELMGYGVSIQLVECGGGECIIFYGELNTGSPRQAVTTNANGLSSWLEEKWNDGLRVQYIGGANTSSEKPYIASETESEPDHNTSPYSSYYNYNRNNTLSPNYGNGGTSGSSRVNTPKRCTTCAGSGRCTASGSSGKFHCHGTGRCSQCSGKGYYLYNGHRVDCTTCNKRGVCKYCRGTGKCSRCNGRGTI